ncbi:cell division protein ZapB [Aliikangiella marina]|uniref:Cell division protein ZapB n=1 Tax=Aliikangiella marina TaxID=1712262 RepID=A0A545T1F9_9GAMM|nr:cell division protein ZapB [Aliikangiella marina]TQV71015.1 cell division protein ZapB [Aliikangiella marina]
MDTSNLSQLESSVSKLLSKFETLQKENRQLRHDRDSLVEKNKLASEKIEAMISKLKEMA